MNIYSVRYSIINSPDESVKSAIVIIGDRDDNTPFGIKMAIACDLLLREYDIEVYNIVGIREIMGENQVIHTI